MGLLLSIVKIFLQAALITVDQEKLLSLIVSSDTSPFKKAPQTSAGIKIPSAELLQYSLAAVDSKEDKSQAKEKKDGSNTPEFGEKKGESKGIIQDETNTEVKPKAKRDTQTIISQQ